ncbi:MAG: hypothetical protein M3380_05330, partial [Chloroflexota bacterium]|nr:hypothetical protein [Chloroflexota bacterium]
MRHSNVLVALLKYLFPVVLFLVLWQPGATQDARADVPFRSFVHLSAEDGLVGGAVQAILEDRQGFMWFGTQQGLNRYDGYHFRNYDAGVGPDGLSNTNIRALVEDSAGSLWIATLGGGLNRLDPHTGAFSHYRPSGGESRRADYDSIVAIAADGRGGLWLATRGGLAHFDPSTRLHRHLSTAPATTLAVGGGRVWVGEPGQVTTYTLDGGKLATYTLPAAAKTMYAMLYDASGRLWVGADGGVWLLENERFSGLAGLAPNAAVVSLLDHGAGQVWVGTRGAGLYLLDGGGAVLQHYRPDPDDAQAIVSDYILGLYENKAGMLWVGTWTDGISRLVPRKFPRHLPHALPLAFAPAGADSTWVGTFGAGLSRIDPTGAALEVYRHDEADQDSLSNDVVIALLREADGGLWAGTLDGLDYLAPGATRFVHFRHDPADATSLSDNRVRALLQDQEGAIWIGTANGLNRFEPAPGAFRRFPVQRAGRPPLTSVLALYGDAQERLWIGGEDGLAVLDPQSGDARVYDTSNSSLCHNFVTAIHPAADGNLWLASWGGGLMHFDPATGQGRCYQRGDGLVDNVVLALAEDARGALWLSTPRGLSRFAPEQERFETFTTADGLPHNDFAQAAVLERPDGSLWFGNTRGIVRFQPDQIPINEVAPPVVLTGFFLANEPIAPGATGPLRQPIEATDTIRLAHDQNAVSFAYAALNYLNPDQNQYA